MDDLFGPIQPWVGVLDAVGVALVLAVWLATRNASDLVRGAVAAFGALFLFQQVAAALGGFGRYAALIGLGARNGQWEWLHMLLLAAGLAAGLAAVGYAHRRVAETGDGASDDGGDGARDGTLRDDTAPWVDLAALAVALAIPVLPGAGPFGGGPFVETGRDITVTVALYRVLVGIAVAAPLLVVARRRAPAHPFVPVVYVLVALGALVLPVAPETFSAEYWTAFASGLVAGLVLAALWGLLAAVVPLDPRAALYGVLAALALLVLTVAVASNVITSGGLVNFG